MTRVSQAVFPVVPCSWRAIPAQYPEWLCGRELPTALHCTALRGEEVQLQSLQQLSPALQPGLTAALHCEICSSSLYSSMSFQMLVWGWDRGSAGASRLVLAPIHQPARPSAILTRWRGGLFSRPGLETGDMQGKDVDNVDLGHKLQLDLYS